MRRSLCLAAILCCFGAIQLHAQACGFVFARIYVTDSSGTPISKARFEFLEKDNRKIWAVHGQDVVKWIEKDSHYFLEEGMCGGHRDVLIRVSAEGFADANKIVDLHLRNPSRPYIFRITLNRKDSKLESRFETLSFLSGRIFDANGSLVTHAKVTATDSSGKKYSTQSDGNGEYLLELPYNQYESGSADFRVARYTIKVEKEHFKPSIAGEFAFIPSDSGEMRYDVALDVQSYSLPIVVGYKGVK